MILAFFANQHFDGNWRIAQIGFGKVIHAVAFFGFQQVMRQHGIKIGTANFYSVPFEHDGIVLEVLGNFEDVVIFQNPSENFHDGLRIFFAFGYWHIIGYARLVGKRHAHQFRLGWLYVGGFGVETKFTLLPEFKHQLLHGFWRVDQVVFVRRIVDGFFSHGVGRQVGSFLRSRPWFGIAKQRPLLTRARSTGPIAFPQDLSSQTAEFQFFKNFRQLFAVDGINGVSIRIELNRNIDIDDGQCFRQPGLFGILFYAFFFFAFELVGVFDDPFDGIKTIQQFGRCFFTKTRNAGYVVYRIAHEPKQINHLIHPLDAPVVAHLLDPHDFDAIALARGFVHENVFGNKLPVVFVGRNHVHGVAFGFSLFGQGANHVVGLIALHHYDGDVEGLDDFFDPGDSNANIGGLFFAIGLVGLIHFMPKRWSMWVKSHGNMGWFFSAHQVPQLTGETIDGRGIYSFGVDEGAGDEGEMRSVNEGVSVQ